MTITPRPLLSLHAVTVARHGKTCFAPLHLTLHAGTCHHLIGHNGAGKTSLLMGIAGLLPWHAGKMQWHHAAEQNGTPSFLYIGHLSGMRHALTVEANLQRKLALHAVTPRLSCGQALQAWGLASPCLFQPWHALSAGQQRRAALAQLTLMPAQLWLLDEPWSCLDTQAQSLLSQHMVTHCTQHQGSVLMTHHYPARHSKHFHAINYREHYLSPCKI